MLLYYLVTALGPVQTFTFSCEEPNTPNNVHEEIDV